MLGVKILINWDLFFFFTGCVEFTHNPLAKPPNNLQPLLRK